MKLDNIDIQNEISSQFGFEMVNLTIQSDISSNITNICTKNKFWPWQRCLIAKFLWKFAATFFQNNFLLEQRQLDQLLIPPSWDKKIFL